MDGVLSFESLGLSNDSTLFFSTQSMSRVGSCVISVFMKHEIVTAQAPESGEGGRIELA